LQNFSAELFHERAGASQIGKTPPKIDLAFSNNCPSMPRLNVSRLMKLNDPAVQFNIQSVPRGDGKRNDMGVFPFVRQRLTATRIKHVTPARESRVAVSLDNNSRAFPCAGAWLILEVNVGELLPAAVLHDEGSANIFDRPSRWEAARGLRHGRCRRQFIC
jgi:hypothetical protein